MVNDSEKLLALAAKQCFDRNCSFGNWSFKKSDAHSFVIAYNGEPVVTCDNNQIIDAKWGSRVADVEVYDVLGSVLAYLPHIHLDAMTIRTDDGFALLGFDGPSLKIAEIPGMEDIDYYRAWVTSKPNAADPAKQDHIVYWDQGNTWCEVLAVFEGVTHEEFVTQMYSKYNEWVQAENSQAIACNGVPIFDGYGGILTTDDAIQLESMWEKSENYKRNHTSLLNNSSKVSLDQQIQSASPRAVASEPTSQVKAKASEPEL